MKTVTLHCGGAQASIVPDMGANCISLHVGDADMLRTPACGADFAEAPTVYGIPLLFPPNRIAGGHFRFRDRDYELPVNEPSRQCHLHGFLCQTPFDILAADDHRLICRYAATAERPYSTFPHAFTVERSWSLTERSLTQTLTIRNDGDTPMPLGVGFHTSLNVCFLQGDQDPDHYRLRMSAAEEIVCDKATILPTGERRRDTNLLRALNGAGIKPQGTPLSRHMTRGAGGAELIHTPDGRRVRFTVSDDLPYWMVWNRDGASGFICPEPQSWIINAPNLSQDRSVSGFRALEGGGTASFVLSLTLA